MQIQLVHQMVEWAVMLCNNVAVFYNHSADISSSLSLMSLTHASLAFAHLHKLLFCSAELDTSLKHDVGYDVALGMYVTIRLSCLHSSSDECVFLGCLTLDGDNKTWFRD